MCGRAIDQSQHDGAVCSVVTAAAACVAGDEVMRPRAGCRMPCRGRAARPPVSDCSRHGCS